MAGSQGQIELPRSAPEKVATPDAVLESMTDAERAEYSRMYEQAFRTLDDEEEKKEFDNLSQQMGMAKGQEQATGVVYEESKTAVSQQQQTFLRRLPDMNAKERIAAITALAGFRTQYIYDRLKSILTPEQLNWYQDYMAQQQFEAQQKAAAGN